MKEGVELLNGPIPISPEQRNELSTKLGNCEGNYLRRVF